MDNKIAYYFEPIAAFANSDDLEHLIALHTRSFVEHGWDVVPLDESVSRRHPLYETFNDPASVFGQSSRPRGNSGCARR